MIFGIANEPGGVSAKDATISNLMSIAVGVIGAAEAALGAPHHAVVVQGNWWTGKIGFPNTARLPHDNVVYDYYSCPAQATGTGPGATEPHESLERTAQALGLRRW